MMLTPQKLLICPVGIDGTAAFAQTAQQRSAAVIGDTFIPLDHAHAPCDALISSPFITNERFAAAFQNALTRHAITHVFTLHHAACGGTCGKCSTKGPAHHSSCAGNILFRRTGARSSPISPEPTRHDATTRSRAQWTAARPRRP